MSTQTKTAPGAPTPQAVDSEICSQSSQTTDNRIVAQKKGFDTSKTKIVTQPVAGDWEFMNKLELPKSPLTLKEYHKVLGHCKPILGGLMVKGEPDVKLFEHPLLGSNLVKSWKGECVLSALFGYEEVEKPKGKTGHITVPFMFFVSCLDFLYLFRTREKQWELCKQLVKHRTVKSVHTRKNKKVFGQPIQTAIYWDVNGDILELYIDLKDQSGKGVGGLEAVAGSWGIELPGKHLMDDWKDCMIYAYESTSPSCPVGWKKLEDGGTYNDAIVDKENGQILHQLFKVYTGGDVDVLFAIDEKSHQAMVDLWLQTGIPAKYQPKKCNTIGGYTNQLDTAKLYQGLGIFDDIAALETKLEMVTSDDEVIIMQDMPEVYKQLLLDGLLPGSEVRLKDQGGTAKLLAALDGGYCKNMQPKTIRISVGGIVIDLDLKGCYMEALVHQDFPLGRPIIIKHHKGEERMGLKTFLKAFGDELASGLWYARMSTIEPLTFDQDVWISKHFGDSTFEDNSFDVDGFEQVEPDDKELKGDFQLNTREYRFALVQHDSLQAMENCSTSKEWAEIERKTVVDCALIYPRSGEVSIERWKQKYQPVEKVKVIYNPKTGSVSRETLAGCMWCRVPMGEHWAQSLIDRRNSAKTQRATFEEEFAAKYVLEHPEMSKKDAGDVAGKLASQEQRHKDLSAEQNVFKITGLAIFGTMGSTHYQSEEPTEQFNFKTQKVELKLHPRSGSYCVANNITARARVAVWALSKSLLTSVVITDGGYLNLNRTVVWDWEGRNRCRVGLNDLCRLTDNELSRKELTQDFKLKFNFQPVGNKGLWKVAEITKSTVTLSNDEMSVTGTKEQWGTLDNMMFEQVASQFYFLDIFKHKQFKFASKDVYKSAASQSQANYILQSFHPDEKAKVAGRGYKVKKSVYATPDCDGLQSINEKLKHPFINMMNEILEGKPVSACDRVYSQEMVGVNDVNKSTKSFQEYQERNILAGESDHRSSWARPISITMFRWQTRAQYLAWMRRHEALREKFGWGIEGFFPVSKVVNVDGFNLQVDVDYDKAVVTIQRAIDKGEMWLDAKQANSHTNYHPQRLNDLKMFGK